MAGHHVFEADFYIGQTVTFVLDSGTVGLVTWESRQETSHFAFELVASERAILR